jgi:hypothetical protein
MVYADIQELGLSDELLKAHLKLEHRFPRTQTL